MPQAMVLHKTIPIPNHHSPKNASQQLARQTNRNCTVTASAVKHAFPDGKDVTSVGALLFVDMRT